MADTRQLDGIPLFSYALRSVLDAVLVGLQERWSLLTKDVRGGARAAFQSPLSSCLAIFTLVVSLVVAMLVASFVWAVFVVPLPIPERIVQLWEMDPARSISTQSFSSEDARQALNVTRVPALSTVGWMEPVTGIIATPERPEIVSGEEVSRGYLDVYAPEVALGARTCPEDPAARCILVSARFWTRALGADPSRIGKPIVMDGVKMTLVGVLASFNEINGYRGELSQVDYWVPLDDNERPLERRLLAVGVVRRSASYKDVVQQLSGAFADSKMTSGLQGKVVPAPDAITGPLTVFAWLGTAGTVSVVLLAYVNLAILFASRGSLRVREFATRSTLGATRERLTSQMVAESLTTLSLGGIIAVLAFPPLFEALRATGVFPAHLGNDNPPELAPAVALFVTTFGAVVAGHAMRATALRNVLKNGTLSRAFREQGSERLRGALMILQLAASTTVIASGIAIALTLFSLTHQKLGFDGHGVYLARFAALSKVPSDSAEQARLEAARSMVARSPGIAGVAWASIVPFGNYPDAEVSLSGRSHRKRGAVKYGAVGPNYFDVLQIPVLRYRVVPSGGAHVSGYAVVNNTFAKFFGIKADVIGRHLTFVQGRLAGETFTINGIAADVRPNYLMAAPPTVYLDFTRRALGTEALLVRANDGSRSGRNSTLLALERARGILGPPRLSSFDDLMRVTVHEQIILEAWFALLSLMAVGFVAASIFAVVTLNANERKHEFAVRRALGARSIDVIARVFGYTVSLAVPGIVLGGIATCVASPTLGFRSLVAPPTWTDAFFGAAVILSVSLIFALPAAFQSVSAASLRVLRHE